VGVEPVGAACVMASLAAGRLVEVPGPHDSIAAGLNCGVPSLLAWPVLRRGLDAAVALDDEAIRDGVRRFAEADVVAGECAGIAPAALLALLRGPDAGFHRARLGLDESSEVLLFVTEGATDPAAYRAIVGGAVSAPGS
jgi:diaminopropionate ammonia-lyase